MMACHCEPPEYSTSHGDGETNVTITSPTDGAHICVVHAQVLADLGIGGNGADQLGGCGDPVISGVVGEMCKFPMKLYTGPIRITESTEFSALSCRIGEASPSVRADKSFDVGFKPTISRSGGTREGGIGDSYTITSTDPNPNDRICYRVDNIDVLKVPRDSLCDGISGQCNTDAGASEFVP